MRTHLNYSLTVVFYLMDINKWLGVYLNINAFLYFRGT